MTVAPQTALRWFSKLPLLEFENRLWPFKSEAYYGSLPKEIRIVDDKISANTAFQMATEGKGLVWRGDFQNAKQLLQAMARRMNKRKRKKEVEISPNSLLDNFHRFRQFQSQRARTLGLLIICIEPQHKIHLRRAPDIRQGTNPKPYLITLILTLMLIRTLNSL